MTVAYAPKGATIELSVFPTRVGGSVVRERNADPALVYGSRVVVILPCLVGGEVQEMCRKSGSILPNEICHIGTSKYLHVREYSNRTDVEHSSIYSGRL